MPRQRPTGPVLLLRSDDSGQTWQTPVVLPLNGASFDHPTMVVDTTSGSRSGAVYLVAAQSVRSATGRAVLVAPVVVSSTDGGRTLSAPAAYRPAVPGHIAAHLVLHFWERFRTDRATLYALPASQEQPQ